MLTVYGIPNCDTTKKAMKWLKDHNIPFRFHDYKTASISNAKLREWSKARGWETFFNKNSTTWKELPKAEQDSLKDQSSAIELMLRHNSIIKRPIVETGKELLIGFKELEACMF